MGKKSEAPIAAQPSKDEKDYEAESAMDSIMRAEEHKADPDMMKRVKKHAGRKVKALKGLHAIFGEDDGVKPIRSTDDLRARRNKVPAGNMG